MSPSPVQLVRRGKSRGRQIVWDAIRLMRRFTILQLADAVKQERSTVRNYVISLAKGGYLAGAVPAPRKAVVYELVRDIGVEAPRLCEDGTPYAKGLPREQMWRTMRMLDVFAPRELAFTASTEQHPVSEWAAQLYLSFLCEAGYLARVTTRAKGRPATYRLIRARYSGPRAPIVQKLQSVFDPNLDKIVWHEEPEE